MLTKRIFTSFAKPDRGFIHKFTSERDCTTPQKLGQKQKTKQFLFTKNNLFTLESDAIARYLYT